MLTPSRFAVVAIAAAVLPLSTLRAQGSRASTRSFTDSIVHLTTGDSIEYQGWGPMTVPNQGPGMVVVFYPFFSIQDTARVRRAAIAFFRTLTPHMFGKLAFVAMRAVDVRAARRNQGGVYSLNAFGVVLESRADGRWYVMGDSVPAF